MAYNSQYGPDAMMPPWPPPPPGGGVLGMGSYVDYGTTTQAGVTGAVNQAMSSFTGLPDTVKLGLVGLGVYLVAFKTKFGRGVKNKVVRIFK